MVGAGEEGAVVLVFPGTAVIFLGVARASYLLRVMRKYFYFDRGSCLGQFLRFDKDGAFFVSQEEAGRYERVSGLLSSMLAP